MQGPTWTPAQREARLAKLVARNRGQHQGDFLYENADWMREAYVTRELTLRQIAAEAGCGLRTVARWMKIHGIATRQEWPRASGTDHPQWTGARLCPSCGGRRASGSLTCRRCRDTTGANNPKWRGTAVEYAAAHARVVAKRGKPTEHECAHCGKPAAEWAYDRSDPDEKRNTVGRDDGPFSLNPAHYLALCVRCHRRLDLGR